MPFTRFTPEQLAKVDEAVFETKKLKRRAEITMQKVVKLAENGYFTEKFGLYIEGQPDGFYAISTPYGKGRGRTELLLTDDGPQAVVHIEKCVSNRLDQMEWHPVWALTFKSKSTFAGSDTDNPFDVGVYDDDDEIYEVASSILYAIAKG